MGIFVLCSSLHSSRTTHILHWILLIAFVIKMSVLELLAAFLNLSTVANQGVACMKKSCLICNNFRGPGA